MDSSHSLAIIIVMIMIIIITVIIHNNNTAYLVWYFLWLAWVLISTVFFTSVVISNTTSNLRVCAFD